MKYRTYKVYVAIPVHEIDSTWYQSEEYSGISHTRYKDAKDELRKAKNDCHIKFAFIMCEEDA